MTAEELKEIAKMIEKDISEINRFAKERSNDLELENCVKIGGLNCLLSKIIFMLENDYSIEVTNNYFIMQKKLL